MMKRVNDILAGLPATILAGICLLLKLFLTNICKIQLPVYLDPAWIAVIITGIPLLYLAVWRVIYNPGISKISSALLICIGMAACIGMTFLTGHDELFAAGEIGFIMSIGAILEEKTTEHARTGLKKLIALKPEMGRLLINGGEQMIPVEDVKINDIIRINPGEVIPVDGIIICGDTSVDQSVMTGESLPIDKETGDTVLSGTMNCYGSIDVKASSAGKDSSLDKMIRMVEEAENQKAPIARIADKAASYLVPVALLIAIAAILLTGNLEKGVTILVVFCPCALVLATPTAVMAGIGQATKHGVIIKSGEALEKMGKVDTIAFDKTGTLTHGVLRVSDVVSFAPDLTEDEILQLAASAEKRSEHPLGKAIVLEAEKRGIKEKHAQEFHMDRGKGIRACVDGKELFCGNQKFLKENQVDIQEDAKTLLEKFCSQGKAAVLLGSGNEGILGVIGLADTIRECAPMMTDSLHKLNVDTVLLTGDHRETARYFSDKIGITDIRAELLPEGKVEQIRKLQDKGKVVCMIGDGVNDAPALKTASIGVAMGDAGSDIAVEAADVALIGDDISRIPYLKKLSDETVKTIKISIALSLCINALAITFSLLGILNPTTGALWHNVGSCFVVLLAASLYDRKIEVR